MTKIKPLVIIPIFLFLLLSIPTFAQVDVPRKTVAVTYPLDQVVQLQFRGTTRFPRMKGDAKIRRTARAGTTIELAVSKMPRPFELGAGYATYVLWAISPDGQVDNLGEIKRRGTFEFDSKMNVTTRLQTFALIITAEPHFLVRRPSRTIMLENLTPSAQRGRNPATTSAIQYFGNSSDYFSDARTPEIAEVDYARTPSAILQAKQAIALAKFAGAQRDALAELQEAETLLNTAENAWRAGRDEETVDVSARRAISVAVKAEATAFSLKEARERRNERTRQDAEVREAEVKYQDAQSEIADLRAELARETRNRELAERDALNYANQLKELRGELGRIREELGQTRADAEAVKVKLTRIETEQELADRRQEEATRLARLQANQGVLMQSLRRFGTVNRDERGIVLTLPENFWANARSADFAAAGESKMVSLGEVLANSTDYKIVVESHTDNQGTPEELESLTQTRANNFTGKLMSAGVADTRLEAKGFGAALPVVPNSTNANRIKNRRMQVILIPNIQ